MSSPSPVYGFGLRPRSDRLGSYRVQRATTSSVTGEAVRLSGSGSTEIEAVFALWKKLQYINPAEADKVRHALTVGFGQGALFEKNENRAPAQPEAARTFADSAHEFLEHRDASADLQDGSYRQIEAKLRLHVLPEIGDIPLRELTKQTLFELFTKTIPAKKRPDGERLLAPKAVGECYNVTNQVLREALKEGYIERNPLETVERPRSPRSNARATERAAEAEDAVIRLVGLYRRIEDTDDGRYFYLGFEQGCANRSDWGSPGRS